VVPGTVIKESGLISFIGNMYYLELPTRIPDFEFTIINIIASLLLLWICVYGVRRQLPLAIFVFIALLIHLANCIYFIFSPDYFPYSAAEYSEYYLKMQIGIWFCVMSIGIFSVGLISNAKLSLRCFTYFKVLAYALVYGVFRYITFVYMIYAASVLYMATIFFTLSPFFDLLYIVHFYSDFIDKAIVSIGKGDGEVWQWY